MALTERIEADATLPPRAQLKQFFTGYLRLLAEDRGFREANELTILKTAFVPELKEGMEGKRAGIRATIDWIASRVEKSGWRPAKSSTTDVKAASFALYGALSGVMTLWLIDRALFPISRRAEELSETILRILD